MIAISCNQVECDIISIFFYANSRKNVKFFALSAFFIIFVSK